MQRAMRTTDLDVTSVGDHAALTRTQMPTTPPNRFRSIRYRNVVLSMMELACWAFLGGTLLGEVTARLRSCFIHFGDVLMVTTSTVVIAAMTIEPLLTASRNISRLIRGSSLLERRRVR